MAFKVVVFAALVAVAQAGLIGAPVVAPAPVAYAAHAPVVAHAAPLAYAHAPVAVAKAAIDTDYDPNPSYSYAYDVQDALTGDSKNQQESRQGDVVQGSYSLTEPDGTRRTVEYTADPVNGFNAVVHKEPLVAKAVVAHAAPVATYAAHAPVVAHAAPVATYAAHAPIATYAAHAPVATYAAHAPVATYAAHAPVATYAAHAPVAAYAAHAPAVIAPSAYAHAPLATTYVH